MAKHEQELQRFQQDIDYFELHQQELLRRYPDEWVAVYQQRVVGAFPDVEQLLAALQDRAIPIDKALIRHLSSKEDLLILVR